VKKILLLLFLAPVLYGQQNPVDGGLTLATGRTASLGVEASTTFAWDLEKESTGLETKAGLELIFDLFPAADKGAHPVKEPDSPAVRLLLKDAAFTWWNTYSTSGGNYSQDDFNSWQARPLILTFDTFLADLVWKNYFFRVASSTSVMKVNTVSLRSIFDDVMDVNDRFYYSINQALWRTERYNIQKLPILRTRLHRDFVNVDFSSTVSGILAGGAEFEKFGFTLKAASYLNGMENNDNAWVVGADLETVPAENIKFDVSALAAINYDRVSDNNPVAFGALLQYQLPLSDEFIFAPYAGFDFKLETVSEETEWELGGGLMFYTRGYDTRASYRVLDFDNVIPIGASLGMNINHNSRLNAVLSWFDPAGRDSLVENFGGFLQLELGNLLDKEDSTFDFALLAQLEYTIKEKITPYIRGGYKPELTASGKTDNMIISAALGCYITPVHFFSFDLRYSMDHLLTPKELETNKGLFLAVFTIRM